MSSVGYRRYVLATLTTVYMLNLVDRGLMVLLLEPIKADLQLSDTQLGFVTGIAFGLFYATLGLPIARWADRANRVTITSMAIGIWGLMVMACLGVTHFIQLVFARIGAAIGEAGCMPPTYSLVGDYFPESAERTRAMTIYAAGALLSNLVTFIIGGWLNAHYGWRMTFFVMGLAGLVLAVLVRMTVSEPRTIHGGLQRRAPLATPLRRILLLLWGNPSLRHLSIALIVLYTIGLGLGPWYAAFLMRSHGMTTAQVGVWLGLIFTLGGMAGVLSGGYAAARWLQNNEAGQVRLCAVATVLLVPCFVAFLTVSQQRHALMALIPLMVMFSLFMGPTYALLQRLVQDDMRATMLAVVMLLANLIGMGIGPQIVGILSDVFRPAAGNESLRYAMLSMSFVAVWAGYHFWKSSHTIHGDLARISSQSSTCPDPSEALQGAHVRKFSVQRHV